MAIKGQIGTAILNGSVNKAVQFDDEYLYFYIRNDTTSIMFASMTNNTARGYDGVFTIMPGESIGTMHGYKTDTLYLYSVSGGDAQVYASDKAISPFNAKGKGSENSSVEYNVVKTSPSGATSEYHLTKTVNGVAENIGDAIDVPLDMVVQSGDVKTCTVANVPVQGYKLGDKYIDLLIANTNEQHIYVLVSDLVDNNASGITYDNVNSGLTSTNVQSAIDELDNSKSDTNHTHNYAASDSAGGAATSAKKLDNTSAIGSATQPVYFNASGVPVPTSYTVEKSVPSNAVFTDTTYNLATTSTNGLLSSTDKKKINIAEPQFAYCTVDTSSTGYYKITINNSSAWMMSFDVHLYRWYHCYNLCVSGYNYGENHWSSPRAITTSSTSPIAKYTPVTFGYNSDGKLWFAVPAGPYTGILINDMNQGMNATITDFSGLFTVEKVTELTGTTQTTVNAYRPVYVNEGLVVTTVPTSATATGIKGDIAYDANYMYVCTDTNVWKRTQLSSW